MDDQLKRSTYRVIAVGVWLVCVWLMFTVVPGWQ